MLTRPRRVMHCVHMMQGKKKSGLPELRKKHAHRMDAATRELVSHRLPNGRRSSLASRMSRTIIEQARLEAKEGTVVPDVLLKDDKFLEVKRLDTMARARKLMTIATRCVCSHVHAIHIGHRVVTTVACGRQENVERFGEENELHAHRAGSFAGELR